MPLVIAPSILAADLLHLGDELASVEEAGADWHHIDVMDGHYVPNLSFGLPMVAAVKKVSRLPLDVHIMVTNPDEVAIDYVEAGADILSFHIEAARHPHRLIQLIHKRGAKAGLALNPGTPLSAIEPLLSEVDLVLLMSVNPGFGGQSFISRATQRTAQLAGLLGRLGRSAQVTIAVDGGITAATIPAVAAAGAQAFVAGSFVYGASDRKAAIAALRCAVS